MQAAVASFKSPAGPRPRTRRGRCLHRPGNLAAAQAPMRRARSPALHCGRERAATDTRPLSARPTGGPMQASAPTQRGDTAFLLKTAHPKSIGPYAEGRHSMTVIRLPCLPSPGYAARLPYIAGRAFTPAGEVCGDPEGHWQGKVRHPSVGWRRQLPLQGSLSGGSSPKASPVRGGGCAARRRRRGALPLCGGNILQTPAGPRPPHP